MNDDLEKQLLRGCLEQSAVQVLYGPNEHLDEYAFHHGKTDFLADADNEAAEGHVVQVLDVDETEILGYVIFDKGHGVVASFFMDDFDPEISWGHGEEE